MSVRPWLLAGLASALLVSACAEPALPPPTASFDGIRAVQASGLPPMNVGAFTPGPGQPAAMDRSITVRAGAQPAPPGGFAKYLGDTIAAELKSAGKLDPNATLVVSGVVTDTHVDSAMPTAHAKLAARFMLVRNGKPVFEKTLAVEETWEGAFIGAVAIPDAFNHYTGLFPKLAAKLYADPEFQAAAKAH